MAITGMNHAVLYVRDARRTAAFYRDVLGFSLVIDDEQGRYQFLRAPESRNHHDIAFFTIGSGAGPSEAGRTTVGLYHIAWAVKDLAELRGDAGDACRGRRPRHCQRPRRQQEPVRRRPTASSSRSRGLCCRTLGRRGARSDHPALDIAADARRYATQLEG
jgi:catechol 2,3-dioxygenase-like lactoylglutathione lyase family enzyme